MSARCRSCNAEIIWAITPSGKRMPLDAQPFTLDHTGLQVLLAARGDQGQDLVRAATEADVATRTAVHRSHFATCPNADLHRKSR